MEIFSVSVPKIILKGKFEAGEAIHPHPQRENVVAQRYATTHHYEVCRTQANHTALYHLLLKNHMEYLLDTPQ
jgi:hypothetical protein